MRSLNLENDLSSCRYCSLVSQANQEDIIGSAGNYDHWFILEVPRPWKSLWDFAPLEYLNKISRKLALQKGIIIKAVMVADDKEYSHQDKHLVIHYYRPQGMVAQLVKREYLLPNQSETIALLKAILQKPEKLPQFEEYYQETGHIRDIIVCTHTKVDLACGRFGTPLYRELKANYANQNSLRVWQSAHFGGHQFAPTAIDFPTGRLWGHLQIEKLDSLIDNRGDLKELRPYYRGWSGWNKWLQIAEGEIWQQQDWDWLNYDKKGEVIDVGGIGIKRLVYAVLKLIPDPRIKLILNKISSQAKWAKVKICFSTSHGKKTCVYEAKVEVSGEVLSAKDSASSSQEELHLEPVKQYKVTQLVRS